MDHLMAVAMRLVSGKWKIALLGQLNGGPLRYGKLHSLIPQMSGKVCTQQLRALERDGLICRTPALKAAKCVEYSITWRGTKLWNSLALFSQWAEHFYDQDKMEDNRGAGSKRQNNPVLSHAIRRPSSMQHPQTTASPDPTNCAPCNCGILERGKYGRHRSHADAR
jgi:DNA-binding HxlR family transcriptional regulator